jgi:bifunctional polynucleotide phosphatase/kinase
MIADHDTVVIISSATKTDDLGGKIAMFDLDGTIITTASRRTHPIDISDWEWKPCVIKKLQKLGSDGYSVIIVTNQAGVAVKKLSRQDISDKLMNIYNDIMDKCDIRILEIYAALDKDMYRKPNTKIYEDHIFPRIAPDLEKIFYVGDAAGRENDFSDSDRKFAYNIMKYNYYQANKLGVKHYKTKYRVSFYTPEEYFLQDSDTERKQWYGFDPLTYLNQNKNEPDRNPSLSDIVAEPKIVILMVGPPASGKSTLAKLLVAQRDDVKYINQDELGNKANCMRRYQTCLDKLYKQSGVIIVDNTNPSRQVRREYLSKIDDDIVVKIINMTTPRQLCEHMNIVRERIIGKKHVPEVAYNKFYKNYEAPTESEAIVINYHFRPVFKKKYHLLMFIQKSDCKKQK